MFQDTLTKQDIGTSYWLFSKFSNISPVLLPGSSPGGEGVGGGA